ncbi:MAG TPA: glycosyltransferase family 4 protein [Elusimicrobiota bacterium]|nr:glycosyltransferase family 4 protein [Elusimicrobiota bacterium]
MSQNPKAIGLIATLHSGLTDLHRHGQAHRLLNYYFKSYLTQFDHIYYFSYFDEDIRSFTEDAELVSKVTICSKPRWIPDKLYALLLPIWYWSSFRKCRVFRVFQATGSLPLLLSNLFFKTPSLVTFGYDYFGLAQMRGKSFLHLKALLAVEQLAIKQATKVLVPNRLPVRRENEMAARKTIVIPNGTDTTLFVPHKGRTPGQSKTVLFVGRFEKEKNLPCLLRAVRSLASRHPIKLLLIGDGAERQWLRQTAKEWGIDLTMILRVAHEDLVTYYQNADVFVLPSFTEGHPKVLIEAMSCAAPCAVSRCRAHENIIEERVDGLLFDPHSDTDCATMIDQLLSDTVLANRLGEKAHAKVMDRYNLEKNLAYEAQVLSDLSKKITP